MRSIITFALVSWLSLPASVYAIDANSFGANAIDANANDGQLDADINRAVNLMRQYCKACHAIQPNKFIVSTNNVEVWRFILTNPAPSGGLWIDQIETTLNWPSPIPPRDPFSAGRDYMPKGSKRHEIVQERIGDMDAREYLYNQVKNAR